MNFNWTEGDMLTLEKQYPDAASFLRGRSLFNEYRALALNGTTLNDWQKKRLRELEQICGFTYDMIGAQDFEKMRIKQLCDPESPAT